MGFEPDQPPSSVESVNEFKEQMENALKEAKAALVKSKDDMAKYYNQRRTPAPDYQPRDKVYLDASNIQTTRPSQTLSHQKLGPFPIVNKVGNNAYPLQLPPSMSRLHPVLNVVKLSPAPEDPIPGRHPLPPPLPEIIDGEEEWVMEEILDSKVINQKLQYLVKWEGYGIEHNSWEPWENVHALDLVTEFHRKHPGAPRHIWRTEFDAITFRPTSSPAVPSCHSLEGGVDVRGHLRSLIPPTEYVYLDITDTLCLSNSPYIPQIASSMPLSISTPKHRRKRTPSYLTSESESCHCCMYYHCVAPLFYFPLFL